MLAPLDENDAGSQVRRADEDALTAAYSAMMLAPTRDFAKSVAARKTNLDAELEAMAANRPQARQKRAPTRKPKARDSKPGEKKSALDNSAETAHACGSGCTCRDAEEAQVWQLEQRAATRRAGRERRRQWVGVSDLEETELDSIITSSGMWKYDPDGDVIVNDERDAVDKDGVLIAVDNTPLHSRVTWKDSDLQETKRRSIV